MNDGVCWGMGQKKETNVPLIGGSLASEHYQCCTMPFIFKFSIMNRTYKIAPHVDLKKTPLSSGGGFSGHYVFILSSAVEFPASFGLSNGFLLDYMSPYLSVHVYVQWKQSSSLNALV
jgi:hypothetical protein